MSTDEEWWGNREAAAHCGMPESLWRDAVSRGRAPAPDIRIGNSPGWRPTTVIEWNTSRRRGRGRPRKTSPEETTQP